MSIAIVTALMVSFAATLAIPGYAAKGGNGGGAVVTKDFPCGTGGGITTQSHDVETPSGNSNLQYHSHK